MFLVTILILNHFLPYSILVMYIFPLAQPWPGIEKYRSLFPLFPSHVSTPISPQVHVGYKLATMPLEPQGPNIDCISIFCPLSHPHTQDLSLSPSLRCSGITTTNTTPCPAQHTIYQLLNYSVILFISKLANLFYYL